MKEDKTSLVTKPFEYVAPNSLDDACQIIHDHYDEAKVLAGGQSLIPLMKLGLTDFRYPVDLKRIPGLSFFKVDSNAFSGHVQALFVGALVTHSEIEHSTLVRQTLPLLAVTAASIGHPLVRNRGTIGGSISHCDPAADLCATALALDARMVIAGTRGSKRVLDARDFFRGFFTTAMERGEILEQIIFPLQGPGTGYAFRKLTLGHGDFPLLVVSVSLRQERGRCARATIALGGVADRAVRADKAEMALLGGGANSEDLERAASIASESFEPAGDLEVSAQYKKKMLRVLVGRALAEAASRSNGAQNRRDIP